MCMLRVCRVRFITWVFFLYSVSGFKGMYVICVRFVSSTTVDGGVKSVRRYDSTAYTEFWQRYRFVLDKIL